MSEIAIELKELRKEFLLSHSGVGSLKTLLLWWKNRPKIEKLTVLKGLSLQIPKGQCAAIIGHNGAGKSTLLSLIARVYKPTSGTIEVKGRIGPLLELGAGFHPDLTGLENIVFNAMILGLTRKEAEERVGAIIEFSELEHHIDAPVRAYSSGMQARLGFAIAANVDAEVLIIDEVLSVGDYSFAKKCFDYIDQFQAGGGTILFVSHDMRAIRRVADRCLWLKNGGIEADGGTDDVIAQYQADLPDLSAGQEERDRKDRFDS